MARVHFMIAVTARQWQVFLWQGKQCCESRVFEQYADQEKALLEWLQSTPHAGVTLLTDLAEEHYHIEVVPHVRGRARKQLLLRKLSAWPPAAGFHAATWLDSVQGMRREDRYLCAGVSLGTWHEALQMLQQHSIEVSGLYLQTSCLAGWVHCLLHAAPQVLCIHGGMQQHRLSYLYQGKLFFSRQLRLPEHAMEAALVNEINQTRMYLLHQHWLNEGEPLELLLVAEDPVLEQSLPNAMLPADIKQHVVTPDALFHRLGLPMPNVAVSAMAWSAMHDSMHGSAPNLATPALLAVGAIRRGRRQLCWATMLMFCISAMCILYTVQQKQRVQQHWLVQQRSSKAPVSAPSGFLFSEKELSGMQALTDAGNVLISAQRSPYRLLQALQSACPGARAWQLQRVQWQYGPQEKSQNIPPTGWQEQAWVDFVQKAHASAEDAQQDWMALLTRLRTEFIFLQVTVEQGTPDHSALAVEGDTRVPRQTGPVRQRLHVLLRAPDTTVARARQP